MSMGEEVELDVFVDALQSLDEAETPEIETSGKLSDVPAECGGAPPPPETVASIEQRPSPLQGGRSIAGKVNLLLASATLVSCLATIAALGVQVWSARLQQSQIVSRSIWTESLCRRDESLSIAFSNTSTHTSSHFWPVQNVSKDVQILELWAWRAATILSLMLILVDRYRHISLEKVDIEKKLKVMLSILQFLLRKLGYYRVSASGRKAKNVETAPTMKPCWTPLPLNKEQVIANDDIGNGRSTRALPCTKPLQNWGFMKVLKFGHNEEAFICMQALLGSFTFYYTRSYFLQRGQKMFWVPKGEFWLTYGFPKWFLNCFGCHLRDNTGINSTDSTSRSALSWAVDRGDVDTTVCLLRCGINPNQASKSGLTPLHFAVQRSVECTKLLVEAGANISATVLMVEDNLLHLAMQSSLPEDDVVEIAEILIRAGAHVDTVALDGETALHKACKNDRPNAMKLLLEYGGKAGICDNQGNNVLCHAIQRNNHAQIAVLLDYGQDHETPLERHGTLINLIACFADTQSLRLLCQASLKRRDSCAWSQGLTPIQIACQREDVDAEWTETFVDFLRNMDNGSGRERWYLDRKLLGEMCTVPNSAVEILYDLVFG